ncbi:MAG: hypothetical protein GX992_05870 [Clostridium sp.]|nr:hypothetical protein [Clostridium sp.]
MVRLRQRREIKYYYANWEHRRVPKNLLLIGWSWLEGRRETQIFLGKLLSEYINFLQYDPVSLPSSRMVGFGIKNLPLVFL